MGWKPFIAVLGTALALLLSAAATASAQAPWPSRTVRLVVPYPPGGNIDLLGRLIRLELSEVLSQAVVIVAS